MSRTRAVGEQEDVVLLAPDFKIENGLRSVNKDTSFLDTIFKYFTNLIPSSINIDRFYN
jgi:hypothetical protein